MNVTVITGPTASGKSRAAMQLAAINGGVIINADSLQLYRDLPILTAQPTMIDKQTLPHKLYGILPPEEDFSTGKWLELATAQIKQAKNPIVVGGTGLYLKALQQGICKIPQVSAEIRDWVRGLYKENPPNQVYAMLQEKDPMSAAKLHFNDMQRVSRALEVFLSTGKSIIEWQSNNDTSLIQNINLRILVLMPELSTLHQNVETRLRHMFDNGAVAEVATLPDKLAPTISKAIGVRQIQSFLQGEISQATALDLSIIATKQYIKRQRTWFRNQFPAAEVFKDINELIAGCKE